MKADERRWLEWIGWIATGLAVMGAVMNNYRLAACFLIWMASNRISAWIHRRTRPRALTIRDLIFFALAAVGPWQWTR